MSECKSKTFKNITAMIGIGKHAINRIYDLKHVSILHKRSLRIVVFKSKFFYTLNKSSFVFEFKQTLIK